MMTALTDMTQSASKNEDVGMFNLNLCIICQKDDKSPVTSGLTGRSNVKRAAEIRNCQASQKYFL